MKRARSNGWQLWGFSILALVGLAANERSLAQSPSDPPAPPRIGRLRNDPARPATPARQSTAPAANATADNTTGGALAETGEPHWIWAADQAPGRVPQGMCYFRKVFQLTSADQGQITITCDDAYELFVNGRRVATGRDWHTLKRFDITRYLVAGRNCIAVRAENIESGSAGLVAHITVRQVGHTDIAYSTDGRWKATRTEYPNWNTPQFDDRSWPAARSLGEFGRAQPWGNQAKPAEGATAGRFRIDPAFHVERVLSPEKAGSLIAMTFNEWGDLLISTEQAGVTLVRDNNGDGSFDTMIRYCDEVKNCQGLLALNGQVFAVGDGPEGAAFYRLSDEDHDDKVEKIDTLFKFSEDINEHGPHAPVLGPDGLIYLMLGNHAQPEKAFGPTSPYHHYHEGDLIQPRYEDPAGHGAGVKAPAGTIIRTDQEGKVVELFAGGLRNAYDMAFNAQGELFTCDSDMESNDGLPWYRPVRVNHVVPGAEFGWRSGWALWPDYYHDSLPGIASLGRGSPSGILFYEHHRYPEALRGAMFIGDWSRGRILVLRLKPSGGTYEAKAEVFLEGQPLNVTDMAVGRDGWLYFCTGGRGTEGGVYRVVFDRKLPPPPRTPGIVQALQQPQLHSAYSREQLAILKDEMGSQWERQLMSVLTSTLATPEERIRALDLMQLLGPYPTTDLLVRVSAAPSEQVRAKSAYLMGLHVSEATNARLVELLEDRDPLVRRTACEAIVRAECRTASKKLIPLLADRHQHVAYAARLALEQQPPDQWAQATVSHTRPSVFIHGALAVLALDPSPENAKALLDRGSQLMKGYLSDDDFLGLLRVFELALLKSQLPIDQVGTLKQQLAEEYPSLEPRINRELVRLLAYLDEPSVIGRFLEQLKSDAPDVEKRHVAMHARFIKSGWTTPQKLVLLEFLETSRGEEGGPGVARFLEAASRDFCAGFDEEQRLLVLDQATRFPTAALSALVKLPEQLDAEQIEQLKQLDRQLQTMEGEPAKQLSIGIVAIMARTRDPQAYAWMREVYERDPSRRPTLAMGLAQDPEGQNWPVLVRSLNVLEGAAAQEVLQALVKVNEAPEEVEAYRQAILCGLRLEENGGPLAVALLEKWTGEKLTTADASWEVSLAAWQKWFSEKYPDQPEAKLPVASQNSKWTLEELVKYLDSPDGQESSASRGELVFEKAQCLKCHRHGSRGEPIGPDLSTVSRRFQRKEILESVLFPSHVISDQYASKTIVTRQGLSLTGLVGAAGDDAVVVLESNGRKTTVARDDIEEVAPHKKSSMPEGLFNTLSLEEIGDLFAYLESGTSDVVRKPARAERE